MNDPYIPCSASRSIGSSLVTGLDRGLEPCATTRNRTIGNRNRSEREKEEWNGVEWSGLTGLEELVLGNAGVARLARV